MDSLEKVASESSPLLRILELSTTELRVPLRKVHPHPLVIADTAIFNHQMIRVSHTY